MGYPQESTIDPGCFPSLPSGGTHRNHGNHAQKSHGSIGSQDIQKNRNFSYPKVWRNSACHVGEWIIVQCQPLRCHETWQTGRSTTNLRSFRAKINERKIGRFLDGPLPWLMEGTIWLWLTVRHGKSPCLIGKLGKPSISMGHLYHGYVSHNQRVIFLGTPLFDTFCLVSHGGSVPPTLLSLLLTSVTRTLPEWATCGFLGFTMIYHLHPFNIIESHLHPFSILES